ncbi:MAG: galactokinase [Planctomycetota bacterium]|jgi:galactokinase
MPVPPQNDESSPIDPALLGRMTSSLELHRGGFLRRFGGDSSELRTFWSPGRVNLMGAHLDYNQGPVLPTSIDRGTFVALRPRKDRRMVLASTIEPKALEVDLLHLPGERQREWSDYPLGVVLHMMQRRQDAGESLPAHGVDVLFGGDLPVGAGLSSSASICVGTVFALDQVFGFELGYADHLETALWAEREFVGVKCGIMDPFAVRLTRPGNLLWVDCKDESFEHLPLDAKRVRIVVADTGVRRKLAFSEFNRRVSQCSEAYQLLAPYVPGATCMRDIPRELVEERLDQMSREVGLRALHVVQEVERTFIARQALTSGDLAGFGRCITEAHASLRDQYEVSIPELDLLVETAAAWEGCFGTRLAGAGFGGCIVALVDADACDGFGDHLVKAFQGRFGATPKVEFFRGAGGPREII